MRRQAPAPWHFGILNLSHGVVTAGITGTLLAYLLRQQGLTPHAIANESSLLILPGTLFFLWCWCIRDACISIPECTQRLSHLTYIRRATWPRKLRRQRRRRAQ